MENLTLIKPEKVQNIINKFCYTIGMIPTSYKMSLTYEEQIIAIGHYLETTVYPAINNNAEALAEVQNAFIDLKNYVDNYFADLDIQAEIEAKLEEMLKNGELTEIIAQFLKYNSFKVFDTLENLIESDVVVNQNVATLGNNQLNDGGNGIYKIIENAENITIDNYFYILLENGLVANLIAENKNTLNPMLFNTTLGDIAKLQNTIDLATLKIRELNEPFTIDLTKIYDCTDHSLILDKGNTRNKLIFKNGGFRKTDAGLLFINKEDVTLNMEIEFNNVAFLSNNESGIQIFTSPVFVNIYFNECQFTNIDTICKSESYIQNFKFDSCLITGGKNNLFEFEGLYGLYLTNCTIEHRNGGQVLKQSETTSSNYTLIFDCVIDNCLIEGFANAEGTGFIDVRRIEELIITNNYFEALHNFVNLHTGNGNGVFVFENNRIHQNASYPQNNGAINLLSNSSNYNMPRIAFNNNIVDNMYALFFSTNVITQYTNYIEFKNNRITNTYISADYQFEQGSQNPPFNILPFISMSNNNSKYSRTPLIISPITILRIETITISGNNYSVHIKLRNGIYYLNSERTISSISSGKSLIPMYFAMDVYRDDILTTELFDENVSLNNQLRGGTANNKFIELIINSTASISNLLVTTSVICVGARG